MQRLLFMQQMNESDPYWRWHDRIGLPRPGSRPGHAIRSANRTSTLEKALTPAPLRPKVDPLDRARADLESGRRRLGLLDALRDTEWREWCAGKRISPYGDAVTEWRRVNAAVAHLEHVVLPRLEQMAQNPSWQFPPLPEPTDAWFPGEFEANPPWQPPRVACRAGSKTTPCFWCREAFTDSALTIEHVIPRWARSLSDALKAAAKTAPACSNCNWQKGAMPPALFSSIRHDVDACRRHNRAWQSVAARFAGWRDRKEWAHLIPEIEAEMLKPIVAISATAGAAPSKPPMPPRSKNKPLKRLYTMEDARVWDEDRFAR